MDPTSDASAPASPPLGGLDPIWSKVETSDAKHLRPIANSTLLAINPVYQIKRATEIFGPLGIGWGYEIVEDSFVQGAPLGFDSAGERIGYAMVHILRLRFWYTLNDKKGEFEHFGQTPFIGRSTSSTIVTDGDVKKKSLTDALSKCLSMLGFSADVYMGLFEDPDYYTSRLATSGIEASEAIARSNPRGDDSPAQATSTQRKTRSTKSSSGSPGGAPPSHATASPKSSSKPAAGSPAQPALDLGTATSAASTDSNQSADSAAVSEPDVNNWLRRIKSLGTDAIDMSRTTAKSCFSGEKLKVVMDALDERERELGVRTP